MRARGTSHRDSTTKPRVQRRPQRRNIFSEGREVRYVRGLHRIRDANTPAKVVLRVARVAIAREYNRDTVYKPIWRKTLSNLLRHRKSSAMELAAWWLAAANERRPKLAHSICSEIATALLRIAEVRHGPLMERSQWGKNRIMAKEGFRVIGSQWPREHRKRLLAQADAIEQLDDLGIHITRLAQTASGGDGYYSMLTKDAEALAAGAKQYLEVVPSLRAAARLIGSRGRIISQESALRGWIIKSLGRSLRDAPNSIRVRFIAEFLSEAKFAAQDNLKGVRRILDMADSAHPQTGKGNNKSA